MKINLIFLMTLVLIPALGQAQVSEEQKALDSFRTLVRRHVDSYKPNGREHVTKLGGGWTKERFTLDGTSAKFDVEKTSSLVSPFIGTLKFTLIRSLTAFHSTEPEAAADTVFIGRDTSVHNHEFAYQDHQWQPTSRQYRDIGSVLDGSYPCDELLMKKEKPSEQDVHGCLEEFDGNR